MNNNDNVFGHLVRDNHYNAKVTEYENFINKSVGSKIEKTSKGEKVISRKDFIKWVVITMAGIAAILSGAKLYKKGKNSLDLTDAMNYMNEVKFKEYFAKLGLDYSVDKFLLWSGVNLPEEEANNLDVMHSLLDFLMEDGFTEQEAWFAISAAFGKEGLDMVAKIYGKENSEEFLTYYGFFTTREDGTKEASTTVLENYVEEDFINNVKAIKDRQENEEKGMGL